MTKRGKLLVGASAMAVAGGSAALYISPLVADPTAPKDYCADISSPQPVSLAAEAAISEPKWVQRFGTINDWSCISRTPVAGVVAVRSEADVASALAYAKLHKLTVSAAGMRHSMGGHAFRAGGVVLDMRGLDTIRLDARARTITVGAGATWHAIQNAIHPYFAVKAMQSTDIFTVGGSIAVNAHGMDHRSSAIMGSIQSMRVMLADGRVVTVSRTENQDLFAHVVGGYGLFGLILSANLEVVPNDVYRSERTLIRYEDIPMKFAAIEADPAINLTYIHLSTAPGTLLQEALVYSYRRLEEDQFLPRAPLAEVSSTKLRRLTINLAKRNTIFKTVKWWAEKRLEHRLETCTIQRAQAMGDGEACLVSRNDPMHDSVAYLYDASPHQTDVLQEYFIPRDRIVRFLDAMRLVLREHDANLVNASLRSVGTEANALSYAPRPAFSVVLYLNHPTDRTGIATMAKLTRDLIDLCHREGGRFFLPYQPHYTSQQLIRSYPEFPRFIAKKRQWDPSGLFSNEWYARYAPAVMALQSS